MKKYILLTALAIISFSSAVFADPEINLGTCSYPDTLSHGIDITAYKQCLAKFNQCPKNGPYLDVKCVKTVLAKDSTCHQLDQLAEQINASADFIQVQKQAGFSIIDVTYPADGGHQYSLLSPSGCLIDTVVDPRDLDSKLKQQYAKNDFYLEAINKPSFTQKPDGTQSFVIEIEAKNQCRACTVFGTAKIAFNFSKEGKWKTTELLSFTKS